MVVEASKRYDVCIVGAGPGGLAVLSSVMEPYSIDLLAKDQAERAVRFTPTERPSVCVVDSHPWLTSWRARFSALEIKWLRSPAMAHPDAFDAWSLAEWAYARGRESELLATDAEYWKAIRGLEHAQAGLFNLPSSQLFLDFCDDLVEKLPHDFVRGEAISVSGQDGAFEVKLSDGTALATRAVVLALGFSGPRIVPSEFAHIPAQLAFHTEDIDRFSELKGGCRVLVVGGGLTAVQAAQLAIRRGCKVMLCSRRRLVTRNFDVSVPWFDPRTQAGLRHDFLAEPHEERLLHLREQKGGGSVPNRYMEMLKSAELAGQVEVVSAQVEVGAADEDGVTVVVMGQTRRFDRIVFACGHRPDCLALPLLSNLCQRLPVEVVGGLPILSQDLQWGNQNIFVVGALAGLAVGPDAANLMGCRRAAQVVANSLGLRSWLKTTKSEGQPYPVAGNRFSALSGLDDSSDEDTSEDESTM